MVDCLKWVETAKGSEDGMGYASLEIGTQATRLSKGNYQIPSFRPARGKPGKEAPDSSALIVGSIDADGAEGVQI